MSFPDDDPESLQADIRSARAQIHRALKLCRLSKSQREAIYQAAQIYSRAVAAARVAETRRTQRPHWLVRLFG